MHTNTNTTSTFNLQQNADAIQVAIRMIAATSGRAYQQSALCKIAAAKVVANTPRLRLSKKLDKQVATEVAKLIESGSLRTNSNGQVAFRLLSDERANVISPELDDLQQRTLAKIAERTEREKKERQADAQPEPQQPKPEPKHEGQPSGLRAGERPTQPGPSQEIWDLAVEMQAKGADRKAIRIEAEARGHNRGTVQNVLGWYFWKH